MFLRYIKLLSVEVFCTLIPYENTVFAISSVTSHSEPSSYEPICFSGFAPSLRNSHELAEALHDLLYP